MKKNKQQQ